MPCVSRPAAAAAWVALALVFGCGGPAGDRGPAPSVFVISLDAASAAFFGIYGAGDDASPFIDRFAADSVVFANAYSQAASTPPSTASLLAGVRPTTHRVTGETRLSAGLPTLPELLSKAGFLNFGVIGNPFAGAPRMGFARGYDEIVQVYALPELQGLRRIEESNRFSVPLPGDVNDQVEKLLPRIRRAHEGGRPVFTYVHYLQPHKPYDPPEAFQRSSDPVGDAMTWDALHDQFTFANETGKATPQTVSRIEARYRGNVAFVDAGFGHLMDRLREEGLYDASLIVLLADHGDAFFKHKRFGHNVTLYDDMTRVPLVFKFPERDGIAPARLSALTETVDVNRTLLDYLGAEQPEHLEGESLMPLIRGETSELRRPEVVLTTGKLLVHAIRVLDFKYVYNLETGEELYDLAADPDEQDNLVTEQPEKALALRSMLESMIDLRAGRSRGDENRLREDPRMNELLESLGYLAEDAEEAEPPDASLLRPAPGP